MGSSLFSAPIRLPLILSIILASVVGLTLVSWPSLPIPRRGRELTSPAPERLPLLFEENKGQTDSRYGFVARGGEFAAFIAPDEILMRLYRTSADSRPDRGTRREPIKFESTSVGIRLLGARADVAGEGLKRAEAPTAYFIGNEPSRWQTTIATFQQIAHRSVYPNVDLICYGSVSDLEYDFIVNPGGDPSAIRLRVDGARRVRLSEDGDLMIETELGEMRHRRPTIYQIVDSMRRAVNGRFILSESDEVGFSIGEYDRDAPLVIDPVLLYSSYAGSAGADGCTSIAIDEAGNAYVTGVTPTLNQTGGGGVRTDVLIRKIDTNRSGAGSVRYSIILGGTTGPSGGGNDAGLDIATDGNGTVYITGFTDAVDFPTRNAVRPTLGGQASAFLVRLDTNQLSSSSLVYGTYLGGTVNNDQGPANQFQAVNVGMGVAVDSDGNASVAGFTNATDFPVRNAFSSRFQGGIADALYGDAFVARINTNASGAASLAYSTYLGGSEDEFVTDISVDKSGDIYVTGATASANFPYLRGFRSYQGGGELGSDAFIARIDTRKSGAESLIFSTFLAGNRDESGLGVAVGSSGVAYAAGLTNSSDFPVRNGFQGALRVDDLENNYPPPDAWVTCIDTNRTGDSALVYSTYLGGTDIDGALDVAVDGSGDVYVTGGTTSKNFLVRNELRKSLDDTADDPADAFMAKINPRTFGRDSLLFSTYLGGRDFDIAAGIAVNSTGTALITGLTNSLDFPLTFPLQRTLAGYGEIDLSRLSPIGTLTLTAGDGFLVKIGEPAAVTSAASFLSSPQARASIAAIFGSGLSTRTETAESLPLPTALAGASVTLEDSSDISRMAPLFFVSPGQINFLVPPETSLGQTLVVVRCADGRTVNGLINVVAAYPALFSANSTGQGVAAALILRVKANGERVYENVATFDGTSRQFVPAPINFGPEGDNLFLILFGTGLSVGQGSNALVTVGTARLVPAFIGPQGSFLGLDQINVQLPRSLRGTGLVNISLDLNGASSNRVQVRFQ